MFLSTGIGIIAQDSDLGELPPLPNLNLGDPDTKPTLAEKRMRSRIEEKEKEQEKALQAGTNKTVDTSFVEKLSKAANDEPKKAPISKAITVHNALPANEDGITASGSRLKPFGDDDYWGAFPEPTPEEALVDLPPLPDLRTPEQVTRHERMRDLMVAKSESRKAEADAIREAKELKERAVVSRPVSDPSTALVQVESRRESGSYGTSMAAPQTSNPGGPTLKPFGDAQYYGDSNSKFRSESTVEEPLMDLPPLPDLRTPDQVTRKERFRDRRIAKAEVREAESELARQQREAKARAVVNRPAADPSTALVQVESRRGTAGYVGNQSAPETVNETTLKPFNENSSYYQDGQLVYKGPKVGESTSSTGFPFWKRLTNKN